MPVSVAFFEIKSVSIVAIACVVAVGNVVRMIEYAFISTEPALITRKAVYFNIHKQIGKRKASR